MHKFIITRHKKFIPVVFFLVTIYSLNGFDDACAQKKSDLKMPKFPKKYELKDTTDTINIDNLNFIYSSYSLDDWTRRSAQSYLLLKNQADPAHIENRILAIVKPHMSAFYEIRQRDGTLVENGETITYSLQNLKDIHLNSSNIYGLPRSDIRKSYILAGIALLILCIAVINFINMSIGRASVRAREIGVRKMLGAGRKQLIRQFWIESICTALISMPALKGHWLTGIGTVIKNYILYSGRPSRYHYEKSAKLGEIWLIPGVKGKTRLVLGDALYPLCDKGPQPDPRYKWAYNGLIAGTDPVAVETVCLKILTEKRKALRGEPWPISPPPICVEAADKAYGLGTSNMGEIKISQSGWKEGLLLG